MTSISGRSLPMTSEELRAWREQYQYPTQAKLARALGVQPLTVTRWELGTRKIPSMLPLALETLARRKENPRDG